MRTTLIVLALIVGCLLLSDSEKIMLSRASGAGKLKLNTTLVRHLSCSDHLISLHLRLSRDLDAADRARYEEVVGHEDSS